MADGRDDRSNVPPGRGSKLRNQGSNPTGSQTMSFTPKYSGELDYNTGKTHLNKNIRANEHSDGDPSAECCKELGLTCKKPLS